ncbi:MAG: type II toxin-antitoxin system RelE/ParE family toxin [Marinomonas colpomeniae]
MLHRLYKRLTLLGYCYEDGSVILELIALDLHEDFYGDVKNLL